MSKESNQKVNAELFSLEPTALLEFFVIYYDYVNQPDEKLYIHGGTNGINGPIYWQGQEYSPFPIQSSGFESKGDGSLPRPKLTVSNQDFFVSNLIRRYNNLVGAKVVRKRTFLKFLDNNNFSDSKNPYGSADSTAGLEDQVFFILRRSSENRAIVEFELASPLELENVTFPRRIVMSRYCSFHYRGNGCGFNGPPVADDNDKEFVTAIDVNAGTSTSLANKVNKGLWKAATAYSVGDFVYVENSNVKVSEEDINKNPNWRPLQKFYICVKAHTSSAGKNPSINKEFWMADQCSKSITGCKLRFGKNNELPFGGFPGTEEYPINFNQ
jgi:lambda family phage minor tail protein L